MIDVFGTLGPSCRNEEVLDEMFGEGMSGIRINLSHVMLQDCLEDIDKIKRTAKKHDIDPKILIDMQGPELRVGNLQSAIRLKEGDKLTLGDDKVPLDARILAALEQDQEILLDDGRIAARIEHADGKRAIAIITRGGQLKGKKSIAIPGKTIDMPALTDSDMENIKLACKNGIYGVMQPFVRSESDLKQLRDVLDSNGGKEIKIYAKIENTRGVENLENFFGFADEIIIARGDLGNAVPLWELPGVQKNIAERCNKGKIPFMVVTQMLSSMEHSKVPTRAEVSDIYNAVLDGAGSVMVTGETAIGEYPVDVIRFLRKTVQSAVDYVLSASDRT